jgi:hypothetical protein
MAKTPKNDIAVAAPEADAPVADTALDTTPAADVIADLSSATLSPEAAEALAKVAPPAANPEPSKVTVSRPTASVKRRDDKNAVDETAITAKPIVALPNGIKVRNR